MYSSIAVILGNKIPPAVLRFGDFWAARVLRFGVWGFRVVGFQGFKALRLRV